MELIVCWLISKRTVSSDKLKAHKKTFCYFLHAIKHTETFNEDLLIFNTHILTAAFILVCDFLHYMQSKNQLVKFLIKFDAHRSIDCSIHYFYLVYKWKCYSMCIWKSAVSFKFINWNANHEFVLRVRLILLNISDSAVRVSVLKRNASRAITKRKQI